MKKSIQLNITKTIILGFTALLLLSSCKNMSEKAAEKIMEKAIENASGEEVDIDYDNEKVVLETEDGKIEVDTKANSWPKEIPSSVPEFKYGKINVVSTNDSEVAKGWILAFSDVPGDAVEKYNAELKKKGFETQTVSMPGMGGTVNGENDNLVVALFAGEGDATLTVQVSNE